METVSRDAHLLEPLRSPKGPPFVVLLKGRLGNQLFQYATAVALRRASGRDILFHTYEVPERELLLPALVGRDFRRATKRELVTSGAWIPWDGSSLASRLTYRLIYRRHVRAKRHRSFSSDLQSALAYDASFSRLQNIRAIEGYFQHPSYWATAVSDVARQIRANLVVVNENPGRDLDSVGVHVRGLDYVDYGWNLPISYYRAALGRVVAATGVSRAQVYGDDTSAVRSVEVECEKLGLAVDSQKGDPQPGHRATFEDFSHLASCAHMVCSNSTFAWWAACLGDEASVNDSHRVVVVPEPWLKGIEASLARWRWSRCAVPEWA